MRRKLILLNSGILLLGAVVLTAQTPAPTLSPNAQKISDGCVAMGGAKAVCDQDAILHELTLSGQTAYQKLVSAQFTADEAKEAGDILSLTNALKAIPSVALPAGPNFTIPACRFSGISGNGPNVTEPSNDPLSPCDVGWSQPGERVIFTFYVPAGGNYRIVTRVASAIAPPATPGAFHFEIDGQKLGSSFTVPGTGGWQTWTDVSTLPTAPLQLPGGIVTFTLVADAAGFNFDQITFIKQ